ncbi:RHS repeat-associated core domain-containing protein [Phaeodactylibacter luteus]|uniref:Uncharacterized protein n=1 Tax=Phaeodactylibacter luteus TaxID=1564516 RepID=A0A5C6REV8_9BACT|nr:hypothetical protein [Phaeodactylibacter luteus]TXB58097.1 hypothetical protein FRY97_21650 [Phaeodactylibacter luteus]
MTPYNYVQNNPILRVDPTGALDTLPDGRYIWEMTDYEQSLVYGDPMETDLEKQWRVMQAEETGLSEISLTWSERAYLLGHMLGFALPSSKLMTASKALPGLSKAETGIANTAKGIMDSKAFKAGIEGMKNGTNSEITVNGVKVVFQADGPFSGFTLFGENGFVVGREALQSSDEIAKTVLHETYRISTSTAKSGGGVSQGMVTKETNDVMKFVERAFNAINH